MSKIDGAVNQLKIAQQNVKDRIEKVQIDLEKFIPFDFYIVELEQSFAISDKDENLVPIELICEYIRADKQYTYQSHLNNLIDNV
jgi:hypothetical protein